jgi:hypothetical protein
MGLELALIAVVEERLTWLPGQTSGPPVLAGSKELVEMVGYLLFGDESVNVVEHEGEEDFTRVERE